MNEDLNSNTPLFALVLHHWKLCLAVTAASIGLAGLAFLLVPRKYEADMKLLVKNARADLVITPGKAGSDAERSDLNENEVNSEMELLHSHDILEAVTRDAKLYRPFQVTPTASPSRLAVERAVLKLKRTLNVSSIRKTNIISVSYTAPDPDLAAYVLKDLGDRYLTAHLAVHSAPGTYNFFSDERAKYHQQLVAAQDALSDFHRDTQIFAMPQQTAAVVARLEDTKAQVKDLDAQIAETEARLAENRRQMNATSDRLVTEVKEIANPMAVQQLKTMLTDLQNKRIALVAKFKPTDRSVVELDNEIRNTQQSLAEMQTGKLSESTSDVNTIHRTLEAESIKAEIDLQGLKTRRAELARNISDYVQRLDGLDQNASKLQDLEEAEKQAEDNYALYSRRLEEARLSQALDRQKFANVTVIEQPVASPVPVSPQLSLALAAGALLGVFASILLCFALGSSRQNMPPTKIVPASFADERVFSASAGD